MDLESYIRDAFDTGLSYTETAQLCLRLYSTVDGLPQSLKTECTKDNLANVFASLAASGFVKGSTASAALYGANFHNVFEKGHWVEVIASIFKKTDTVDMELREQVFNRLTSPSSGTR